MTHLLTLTTTQKFPPQSVEIEMYVTRSGAVCMMVNKKRKFGLRWIHADGWCKWECPQRKGGGSRTPCYATFHTRIVNWRQLSGNMIQRRKNRQDF